MRSREVFELFLSRDGVGNELEIFEIDQSINVVFGGVGARSMFAVDCDSMAKAICHADVKTSGFAGEDVNPEVVLAGRHGGMVALG